MYTLYLLKLRNRPLFKFGITSNSISLNRIRSLRRHYDFDLEESYLVKCPHPGLIRALENTIRFAYEFECPAEFRGKDGATELRPIGLLDSVLEQLRFQSIHFSHSGLELIKGITGLGKKCNRKKRVVESSPDQISDEELKRIDELVKMAFEEKRSGLYGLIVNCYTAQLEKFKPHFFIKWLAQRLDINADDINYWSLVKATSRRRKYARYDTNVT